MSNWEAISLIVASPQSEASVNEDNSQLEYDGECAFAVSTGKRHVAGLPKADEVWSQAEAAS
jgi:hypothetical protein